MRQPESCPGGGVERPRDRRHCLRYLLRVFLGIAGVMALAWGALWISELIQAFGPEFNPSSPPQGRELRRVTILGCLGVLASLAAGGSGLAYARTAARSWVGAVVVSVMCAVPLFVVWLDVWVLAGGCS